MMWSSILMMDQDSEFSRIKLVEMAGLHIRCSLPQAWNERYKLRWFACKVSPWTCQCILFSVSSKASGQTPYLPATQRDVHRKDAQGC